MEKWGFFLNLLLTPFFAIKKFYKSPPKVVLFPPAPHAKCTSPRLLFLTQYGPPYIPAASQQEMEI